MKRTLLISMVLLMASVVMAGPITREQARQKAAQFLVSQGKPAPRSMSPAKVKASNGTEVTQYYVFNIGQRQGFVIVSGDDRTDAILGWADEGELDTNNMPENLRAWLQGYADQLQWLEEHPDAPAQHAPRRTASATRQPIAPMMTTKWDQGNPYNYYCPILSGSERCATGCAATSTAQVMYHRAKANSITTTTTSKAIPAYTKDFIGDDIVTPKQPSTGEKAIYTFDWSKMTPTYDLNANPSSDVAAAEVAHLMEYVGAGLKMAYGSSSSAFNEAIPSVLQEYFGYDDAVYVYRCYYTYEDWINIIYNELKTNGPTVMGGQSTGGGHSFVCDGYSEEDYVHINWGWSGQSDGYFKLSVLYPEQQGIGGSTSQDGYSMNQCVLLNIKPVNDGEAYVAPTASAHSTSFSVKLTDITGKSLCVGEPVTIHAVITNADTKNYSGSLTLYDYTRGKRLAGKQAELAAGATTEIDYTFTPDEAGTFELLIVDDYDNGWNNTLTITVNTATPQGTIKITGVTITTPKADASHNYGSTLRATLNLKETGTTRSYHAPLIVKVIEWTYSEPNRENILSGYYTQTKSYDVNVSAGITGTCNIELTGLSTSTYKAYSLEFYHLDNTQCIVDGGGTYNRFKFYCDPGVTVYLADGTETTTTPATNITGIAADALAVDVSDITGVTKITPGGNPNTLYFINAADNPTGLDGCNVVKNGTCAKLTLTDGYGFWTPKDFTATEATFTRTFTNGVSSGSSNGWYTIILPFAVSQVKQGENVIDWFRSASEEGKNFWLKTFSSEDGSTVNFDFAGSFNANTPYIIAVPGNEWGDKWDLRGKPITFLGTGVTISADAVNATNGFTYKFAGVTKTTDAGTVYQLNAAGNQFQSSSTNIAPFCAYFKANGSLLGSLPEALSIGSEGNEPTAISNITTTRPETDGTWYTLDGRRVENPTKGIYIKNGKKVVIK